MIFRISQKLRKKIKVTPQKVIADHENPFADWSAHLFTAMRAQYVIITNTQSLYSVVMHGQGITDDSTFIDRALSAMREFMKSDGFQFQYERFISPKAHTVVFSKNTNRPVIGSVNDLIFQAQLGLTEGSISPREVSVGINDTLLSMLNYDNPKKSVLGYETMTGFKLRTQPVMCNPPPPA